MPFLFWLVSNRASGCVSFHWGYLFISHFIMFIVILRASNTHRLRFLVSLCSSESSTWTLFQIFDVIDIIGAWSSFAYVISFFGLISFKFNGDWLVCSTKRSWLFIGCWSRTYILRNFSFEKTVEFCFPLNHKFWSWWKMRFEVVGSRAWCIWSESWCSFFRKGGFNRHHGICGIWCIPSNWSFFRSKASATNSRTITWYFSWFSIIWSLPLCKIATSD